jgi:ribosome-associated heat shock protein Hsp15
LAEGDRRRIDKWLWFARFAKTRTAAQALAVSGRVRVNREKSVSASRPLKVGDVLTVGFESGVKVLKVVALGERRGPAPEAQLLYEDLTPPPQPGEPAPGRVGPRPSKRDRRKQDAFRGGDDSPGSGEEPFRPDRREGW